MPKIVQHKLKSLSDYIQIVQDLQARVKHPLWFRGMTDSTYKLVPTLYRHPRIKISAELNKLENELLTRFRQRSIPYRTRDLSDDWEALFFMQHYAVPTRLLDWTENPLTALHFALMHASARKIGANATLTESVIWVIDPVAWNRTALSDVSYNGGPLSTTDEDIKSYAPRIATMKVHPVALYGAHNSPRIVAQQGVFTIFGTGQSPMEDLVTAGTFPRTVLTKIVVSPSRVRRLRKSLLSQGITEVAVFPDLEGLAAETKRHFGFEG
jgi:FRG domain-containing protein